MSSTEMKPESNSTIRIDFGGRLQSSDADKRIISP